MNRNYFALLLLFATAHVYGQMAPTSNSAAPAASGAAGQVPGANVGGGGAAATDVRQAEPVIIRTTNVGDDATTTRPATLPAPPPMPPLVPSSFENFVTDTVGHELKVFGRDLFTATGQEFQASTGIAAPADYVIGPGDEIRVRTSGKIDIDARVTVDRNGQIFLPNIGTLTVAGQRADQLTEFLRSAIAREYKGFELSASLGQLRSIQIFVLGQARRPGVYTVSSLSTLVNALFASGGPSASGSLRDIQLKRDGKILSHFDVYGLLLNGDKSADLHLLPGDIVYIPVVGPQIAMDGEVTTPGIFELKGTTTVDTALTLAGGLTPVAGVARVELEHIIDHVRRTATEVALNGMEKRTLVESGDILRVFAISSQIADAVTLKGNVGNPGRYAWHPGMRIADLIPSRLSLLTRKYFNQQNSAAPVPSARPFSPTDANNGAAATRTTSAENSRASATTATAAVGNTASAGTLDAEEVTPKDLANHDSEINWNYAVIERLGVDDLTTHLVPFALGTALDHPESAENKELLAGDTIVIYGRSDINLPLELRAKFIRIDGEVMAPGVYRAEGDESLQDLVRRAGGLAPHAYLYAAQLTRSSVRIAQEIKLKDILARERKEVFSPLNVSSVSKVTGNNAGGSDLELRNAYLAELAKIRPTGRVVLQLTPAAKAVADVPALPLEDGDHLFVPAVPSTIDVLGSVFNQGALRFIENARAGTYLNASGGLTRDGDQKHEFILRADGTLISRQYASNFLKLPIYPGDTVVVPIRLRPGITFADVISIAPAISSLLLTSVVALQAAK